MPINKAALDLIKEFEGWRPNAYPDPATGGEPITLGYGHTSAAGPPDVRMGMTITQADGEEILARDLRKYEQHVKGLVQVPLNENQYGALVSFCFNLGPGNLAKSTLLRKLNAMDYAGAAGEFIRWNRAAGKEMRGLTRRREAEAKLFRTPAVAFTSSDPIPPPPDIEPVPVEDAYQPTAEAKRHTVPWWVWAILAVLVLGIVGFMIAREVAMLAEIILAILCIIAGCISGLFAFMVLLAAGMGNSDDDTVPFFVSLFLAIAFIGGGIAILIL